MFYVAGNCPDASERSLSGVFIGFANHTHWYRDQISVFFRAVVEKWSEDAKILMSKICALGLILLSVAVTLTVINTNEHLSRSKVILFLL